jgi:hypothetical protein
MTRKSCPVLLASMLWLSAVWMRVYATGPQGQPSDRSVIDYDHQVKPILSARCLECHNQEKRKGGLSLATYGDALDGGRSGAVIRPGNASGSLLVQRLLGNIEPQMPKDEDPLDEGEVAVIRSWIDQGARAAPGSPPAPQPWEAPLALERPEPPLPIWTTWSTPIDRFVAAYLSARGVAAPELVSDAVFARRAYLDVSGLLPPPEELDTFLRDTRADKRERLVEKLLSDDVTYAEHWISFWNDLLRNEDGVTYFSETAGRKGITDWLLAALRSNLPYDQFVSKLLNPTERADPDGFLVGVNWRGETSAAVTPWMQASQNTAQIFLGVNLKCNSCHDSFVSKWKLKDAYALAGFFSPEPVLQLNRCDVALQQFAEPGFLYPELNRVPPSSSLADRRATAAAIFTDRRNGRLARTLVNRVWHRLLGRGIVANSDEMDGKPWSPDLLDWIASDFVEHGYDLKHVIATIIESRTYQMPAVAREHELPARDFVFAGPEIRRLTAEQFADAIGAITGEWSVYQPPRAGGSSSAGSDPVSAGTYAREWRVGSTNLTRALGRPVRDQVTSVRAAEPTTPQALELVNGELLTRWLSFGARRMLRQLPPEPLSLFNKSVAGRNPTSKTFEVDVSNASKLWLIVMDTGSNAPERVEPVWASAEFLGPSGSVSLSSLKPADPSGLRPADDRLNGSTIPVVRVKNPSRLEYDIRGRGFTQFRGVVGVENAVSDIGSTLNPQIRFFIFDSEPTSERLVPPAAGTPLPAGPALKTAREAVDRVFWYALGRAPSAGERRLAESVLKDPAAPERLSPDGLADLLWAVLMKPEFQLIY